MANFSKIVVEIFDWSLITVGSVSNPSVHRDVAEPYFVDCILTASTNQNAITGNYKPETSNFQTCLNMRDTFEASYGQFGTIEQLPVTVSQPIEGDGGNWEFEVEMTEYGWDYWETGTVINGISILAVDEVAPVTPVINSITASTAVTPSERNIAAGFNVTFNNSYPFIRQSPIQATGSGLVDSFEFFRFPEPKSQLTYRIGEQILTLLSTDITSPPDVAISTNGNTDIVTFNTNYELDTSPNFDSGDDSAYFVSYNYSTYTLTDNLFADFNIQVSNDFIGHTLRLRVITVDPNNVSNKNVDYISIGTITSNNIRVFTPFDVYSSTYSRVQSFQLVVTADSAGQIINSGSTLQIVRGNIISYNDDSALLSQPFPRVDIWEITDVTTASTEGTATATIIASKTKTGDISTVLQYSLNGVDYQNSNVFSGLDNGNYTAYILDTYGLTDEFQFVIDDVVPPEEERPAAFIDISPVNSIQFSDETKSGTFFSRYDKQKFTNIEFQNFYQFFTQNDIISTQIRNNYETITIDVIDCVTDEIVQNPNASLKIKNQDLVDKRDCSLKAGIEAGTTYIYFIGGNVYDPTTDDVIGKNILNGNLENWMKEGIKITISDQNPGSSMNGTYDIIDRLYDASIPAEVMVISATFSETESYQAAICESKYDDEIWDVYEFDTDFSQLQEGYYYIRVSLTDTNINYPDRSFISEPIRVGTDNKALKIDYGSDNRVIANLISNTGISHRLRIPSQLYEYDPTQEVDSFIDDFSNEIIKKRTTKVTLTFKTGFIAPYLARKLNLAFLHSLSGDTFTIDDIAYTPIEESENEAKTNELNPFVLLTQKMQLTEGSVSTDGNGTVGINSARVIGTSTSKVIGV